MSKAQTRKKEDTKKEDTKKEAPKDEEQAPKRTMAETLQRYRGSYVACTSPTGRSSLRKNDQIAKLLEGQPPEAVVAIAERALGLEAGELWAKYEKLNPGQQRMNAGNRIRAAVKRGDLDTRGLEAAIH